MEFLDCDYDIKYCHIIPPCPASLFPGGLAAFHEVLSSSTQLGREMILGLSLLMGVAATLGATALWRVWCQGNLPDYPSRWGPSAPCPPPR